MADKKNTVFISAELQALTEKQVNKFVTQMVKSITNALKAVSVDFSKVGIKGLDKVATRAANQFEKSFNTALKEITVNPAKIKSFKVPVSLDLSRAKGELAAFARENALTVVTTLKQPQSTGGGTSAGTSPLPTTGTLDQRIIDRATQSLHAHRSALRAAGLETREIDKETGEFATTLRRLQASLDNTRRVQEVKGQLDEKEITRSRIRRKEAEDLISTLQRVGTAQSVANTETRRGEAFMDSFGFRVGILGFGLGILGGHLQRFSQFAIQAVTTGARLIEPLERIRNLLFQDPSISEGERTGILAELNRLADFPGASLETTAKTFRSLQTLGLATADTLRLLEGLTKATARSGIGAEGLDRIAAQLRDFASTGQLKQQEIRSIISAGGRDIANIFATQFGGTDATTINKFGPEVVIQTLITELQKLPEPIATATDQLNRMQNAVTRMVLALEPLIKPGLVALVSILQSLEPIIIGVVAAFSKLPKGLQEAISLFIVLTPLVAALAGTLLTIGAAVFIALASFRHFRVGLRDVRGILLGTATQAGVLTGTVRQAGTQLTILGAIGTKIAGVFKPVTQVFSNFVTQLKLVSLLAKNPHILNLTRGGTTPIIGTAAGLVGLQKVLALLKGGGAASLTLVTTSLAGILKTLPKILGFTGPIGILINLLLALITNAGHARDVVGAALTGLGESLSKLFEKLGTTGTSVLNTVFNILGAIVTFIGGALGAALSGIITQVTAIVDAFAALLAFAQDPTWENLGNVLYETFTALVEGFSVLGGLLAASFLEAIAEALKDTKLGNLLGTDSLAEKAATIRKNIADAYNTAPIDKAAESTKKVTSDITQLNDELDETDKLLGKLEKSVDKLYVQFSRMLTDLTTKQIRFNLSLESEAAEDEFDKLIKRDPDAAQAMLPKFLETQTSTALKGIRAASADTLKAIGEDIKRVLDQLSGPGTGKTSVLAGVFGTEFIDAFSRFRDALMQVNNLAAAGTTDLQQYAAAMDAIKATSTQLEATMVGANLDTDVLTREGTISAERSKEQRVILRKLITEALDAIGQVRSAVGGNAEEEQRANNASIKQQQQKLKLILDTKKAIDAEKSAQAIRLLITEKEHELALEEERIQKLVSEGKAVDLTKSEAIRTRILELRKREALLSLTEDDLLEKIRISNQNDLDVTNEKWESYKKSLATLKEISEVQRRNFQENIDNVKTFIDEVRQGLATLATTPGLGTFTADVEAQIQTLISLQNLLSTDVRDARQRLSEADARLGMFAPPDATKDQITDRISALSAGQLKTRLLELAEASTNVESRINQVVEKMREMEESGDNSSQAFKEQAEQLNVLTSEADSYGRIIKFINALLKVKTKTLDEATQKQVRLLESARAEAQWRQEVLEIQLETIELQSILLEQQAGRGEIGFNDIFASIGAQRKQAQEVELRQLEEKTKLLLGELEIRRLNLEAQMRLTGATQAEIDAMNALFAARKKAIEDNKARAAGVITGEQLPAGLQYVKDLNTAFDLQTKALLGASNALTEYFAKLSSGQGVIAAFVNKILGSGKEIKIWEEIVKFAFAALGEALTSALVSVFTEGGSFLSAFGKFLGQILVNLGTLLISVGTAALAAGILSKFFPFLMPILNPSGIGEGAAIAAIAVGTGLVATGALLGAISTPGKVASANTAGAADRSTGAQRNTFEPNKDPRFIFQKTMLAQINLEIKTDDSQIIKAVINGVNQNGRLTRLIGNRKLAFTV